MDRRITEYWWITAYTNQPTWKFDHVGWKKYRTQKFLPAPPRPQILQLQADQLQLHQHLQLQLITCHLPFTSDNGVQSFRHASNFLAMGNIESSNYVFLEIFYAHALAKLNCTSNFSSSRNKIMPMAFMVFRWRLRGLICGGSVHFLVEKFCVCGIFFSLRAGLSGGLAATWLAVNLPCQRHPWMSQINGQKDYRWIIIASIRPSVDVGRSR